MNEWLAECESGADEWMSEWSADGMNVIVLHELRATHRLKTELFSVAMKHIYTKIGVCERDQETREKEIRERDKREKTGIKSVRLEDCFWLHRNQQHYTNNNQD